MLSKCSTISTTDWNTSWIDRDRNILIKKELFTKEWEMNTTRIVEVIILLDMMQTINNKSHDIINVNLIVSMNNKVV